MSAGPPSRCSAELTVGQRGDSPSPRAAKSPRRFLDGSGSHRLPALGVRIGLVGLAGAGLIGCSPSQPAGEAALGSRLCQIASVVERDRTAAAEMFNGVVHDDVHALADALERSADADRVLLARLLEAKSRVEADLAPGAAADGADDDGADGTAGSAAVAAAVRDLHSAVAQATREVDPARPVAECP
ncbi:MAG: hypothetical protein ACT4OS_11270 [Acidimicrobiales bacterium]